MSYLAIYEDLVKKYTKDELSLYWKDFESAKASLYYDRRKNNPSFTKTVNEIVISGDYTQTSDNKPFSDSTITKKQGVWCYSCLI